MSDELHEERGVVTVGPPEVSPIPRKDCPYNVGKSFIRIFVRASVAKDIRAEGRKCQDHEIGGALIGGPFHDDLGPYLIIEGHIPAGYTLSGAGYVTFTAETWTDVLKQKEERFADSKIVGWYHTHPGFGVFMSDHDVFIHKSFFSTSWLVAYVVDPKAEKHGFFGWLDGELSPVDVHYVFDESGVVERVRFGGSLDSSTDPSQISQGKDRLLLELKSAQERLFHLESRLMKLERLMRVLVPIGIALLVGFLVLLFDRYPVAHELRQIIHMQLENGPASSPAPNPAEGRGPVQ